MKTQIQEERKKKLQEFELLNKESEDNKSSMRAEFARSQERLGTLNSMKMH